MVVRGAWLSGREDPFIATDRFHITIKGFSIPLGGSGRFQIGGPAVASGSLFGPTFSYQYASGDLRLDLNGSRLIFCRRCQEVVAQGHRYAIKGRAMIIIDTDGSVQVVD